MALLAGYLSSYALFSVNGRYISTNHGASGATRCWAPWYLVDFYISPVGRQKLDIRPLGFVYLPCWVLDRLLWHRDQDPWSGPA